MAARSIASLSLSFGLVSIPVRVFAATESSSAVRFNLLTPDGSRVRQQYVSEKTQKVVPRSEMVKGYEFENDRYVIFEPQELKALEEGASHQIEIVSFPPSTRSIRSTTTRRISSPRTSAAASPTTCCGRQCRNPDGARSLGGPGSPSSMWSRCAHETKVWCCSSSFTPMRCGPWPNWTSSIRRPAPPSSSWRSSSSNRSRSSITRPICSRTRRSSGSWPPSTPRSKAVRSWPWTTRKTARPGK